MSKQNDGKLGEFLRKVSSWQWDEFVKAEHDEDHYTSNQAIIFALVRACVMRKLPAIKIAINRLDGKLKTPVKIEMPKVYYLYPHATPDQLAAPEPEPVHDEVTEKHAMVLVEDEDIIMPEPIETDEPEKTQADLPSMSFRETLTEMSDYPRSLPQQIVDLALQTEQALRNQAPMPAEIPMVKSVVAAHLLIMAQSRNLDAMAEVFDQIDGKLVETIQILGEDIYITSYSATAPPEAYLNDDGILQVEATASGQIWAEKLGKELKK